MKMKHKYAPKTWQELMKPANPRARLIIERLFTKNELASDGLLLYDTTSDGGTGKSTLVNLYSDGFGGKKYRLDTTGNKITDLEDLEKSLAFDSGQTFGGIFEPQPSLVVGHEISESSVGYINGLRDVMDRFSSTVIFLFTDNNYSKLAQNCPQMFKNQRCVALDFDTVPQQEIKDYCYKILEAEYELRTFEKTLAENKVVIDHLIKINKASIRGVITGMENNCI